MQITGGAAAKEVGRKGRQMTRRQLDSRVDSDSDSPNDDEDEDEDEVEDENEDEDDSIAV